MSTKKGGRRRFRWGRFLFIIIVLVLAGFGGYVWYGMSPIGGNRQTDFTVNEGESLSSILERMQADGLIRSASIAKVQASMDGVSDWYAGTYALNTDMSAAQMLEVMADASNAVNTTDVKITIPEGWWAKEVAAELAENFPYTEKEILNKWNDAAYIKELAQDYNFLNVKALSNKNLKVKLEGYLFPETYMIDKDADIDQITRTFLDQFQVVYDELKPQFEKSGMTVEQVVTLASIIQFESGDEAEMKNISGVFHNRLAQSMRLESSVTVCYALYDKFDDPKACETSYDIDSPYNTYINEGLPPGPILNPGKAAIEAALEPADHDYLFFVADIHNVKSNPGKVYYAKTYEEHEQLMKDLDLVIE